MSARTEILARIRAASGAARPGAGEAATPLPEVPRDYRTEGDLNPEELLDLLAGRLIDYRAQVHRCRPDQVPATVADVLSDLPGTVVVPAGLNLALPPPLADRLAADSPHDPLDLPTLDRAAAVITGSRLAIAQTGTIVLDGSPAQGRRAISLVPDVHICLVERIVQTVPEALALLDPTRPLTFISGPSATSDIELNRVEGVHGPRTLIVILITP